MSIEEAYNSWSSQYDSNSNKTRDLDGVVTRQVLDKLEYKKVLELGSGTGKNTENLLLKAQEIIAVDFSEEMLKVARQKIKSDNVSFIKADITKTWDWTKVIFDLVTCNLTLEHIEDLDFIFSSVHAKLNQGGHFFISELHPFKQYTGTKARFDSADGIIELESYTHHISEFLNVAEDSGFKLVTLNEWFDDEAEDLPPRILSLLFQKP